MMLLDGGPLAPGKRVDLGISAALLDAAADGETDDTTAMMDGIRAAISRGVPLSGGGRTYGIAGNLLMPANTWLQDIAFRQLTPGTGIRTLETNGGDNIRLVRTVVDRNGNGLSGNLNGDAGIHISGGSGHYFDGVEVYGDDVGSGFLVWNASNFECFRVYAHDIAYAGPDPGDDSVQGLWFSGCSDFSLVACKAHDLGGFSGGPATQYSRAFSLGGCSDWTAHNCRAWDVDQGFDVTGSEGNVRFEITGGLMRDCYTVGWKFANSARDGSVTGAVAERCGLFGFGASGPAELLAINTSDLTFYNCCAYDTGSNGVWGSLLTVAGFRIDDGETTAAGVSRGIRFIACKAHDRQSVPTMEYGFFNDVAANTDGRYNETIDCISTGHTVAAFSGMNASRCTAGLVSGTQSIPNATWTAVSWTTETDLGAMHNASSDVIRARRAGTYRVTAGACFDANAIGVRGIRLTLDGNEILGTAVVVAATGAGTSTNIVTTYMLDCIEAAALRVEVYQNSTGALDITQLSAFTVAQV